jgi:hypothetical protein
MQHAPRRLIAFGLTAVFHAAGDLAAQGANGAGARNGYEFNDSHFHLTNYIQRGVDLDDFLRIMGSRVGRSTLFGIPLQQHWSYAISGDKGPTYYLETDAPLYYYSFTDAYIAQTYLSLPDSLRARFDPMITGFNPADMYAADHIRRVLGLFPGVFSGIGEFTIHKEFVSGKIPGEIASLTNPALDSIFELAAEVGLVVLIHNDIDVPFAKPGVEPLYLEQMKALLARHPRTVTIWAHTGLGRVVHPAQASAAATTRSPRHIEILDALLADPAFAHVHFDISWDELAKYVVATPEATNATVALIERYPDRVLFGTDVVAPADTTQYFAVYERYAPLWDALTPRARHAVLRGNYERLFDAARTRVRAWERSQAR